jgi:hypothetical protein
VRGTLLAALDVHPRVAMQILRHSRIAVTMEIYTEVTSDSTRAALKRLGDELSPQGNQDDSAPEPPRRRIRTSHPRSSGQTTFLPTAGNYGSP